MILRKISLTHFRNYKSISINLNPSTNIFIGNNAQGKTNILESIYVLAITKSHRMTSDSNLIQFGSNGLKIKGTVKTDKVLKDMEVSISSDNKKVKINNNEIRRVADYISNLNVILFTPDDLEIVKGSPGVRRNLLNVEISQISRKYLKAYNTYNKLLKMRNEYLKILFNRDSKMDSYFEVITDKLIEEAIVIYQIRYDYLKKINESIGSIYEKITTIHKLRVDYQNNLELDLYTEEEIRSKLLDRFKRNFKRELSQGMTLYGPHRDDFSFFIDEGDLKFFGSQGQQRLAIISFKLAEIKIFKEYTNTLPILLLDDIFSEIDRKKKNKLLRYISDDIQTIITTTDISDINKRILMNSDIFTVVNGQIEKESR